jgi:hypothetical protein
LKRRHGSFRHPELGDWVYVRSRATVCHRGSTPCK